jgi:hypothetical protein
MPKKVLFTQWFDAPPEVQTRNLFCLYKNLANPAIDKIVVFADRTILANVFSPKLQAVTMPDRLSYNTWFDYGNLYHADDIKILTNSDVFLTETINRLDALDSWSNTLYVVSRKDLTEDGRIVPSTDNYGGQKVISPAWSQDCWIYKDPLPKLEETIYLGVYNCENNMRILLQLAGTTISNLTASVECLHVDWRAVKKRTLPDYVMHPLFHTLPKPGI